MGGPGTIDFHPMTNALVVNQTPDIQDQVQDLLNALRRLIDQEVAVEVKFISIAEDFFERIGVNFNMNIVNNSRKAHAVHAAIDHRPVRPAGLRQLLQPRRLTDRSHAGRHADERSEHPHHEHDLSAGHSAVRRLPRRSRLRRPDARSGFPQRHSGVPVHGGRPGRHPYQRHAGAQADAVQRSDGHPGRPGLPVLHHRRQRGQRRIWPAGL